MRILYCAIDQKVPGTTGGSVHVRAVAEGLAALGHEVHALVSEGVALSPGPVQWHVLAPPFGLRQLRLAASPRVGRLARTIRPDVVIERYYNFGGEGMRAGVATGALKVLEVNAPVIDYPGSPKHLLDRTLLFEPMRRWRDWQCRTADLIVTPDPTILPACVSAEKIVPIEWGADTDRFRPDRAGTLPMERRPGDTIAVFAGAFRRWHGAANLVDAITRLRRRGQRAIKALLVGDGPELSRVRAAADHIDGIVFTGAVPHELMPGWLAASDIGVAPFDLSAHAPLRLGFYWSPLKVFEYMASGLPVVAPDIGRLRKIVRHDQEAVLYNPDDPDGLARALEALSDPVRRRSLGSAARARVVSDFSWAAHCARLDAAIRSARSART